MSAQLTGGVTLAVVTALVTNMAFLLKHRGAVAAPAVDIRRPLRSAADLFRSRWWTIGFAVAAIGWAAHVGALALASLSLVQAVIAGGFVFLAVLAERWFGFALARRQWTGVALVAVGLALLGATAEADAGDTVFSLAAMIAFQGALIGLTLVIIATSHAREAIISRRSAAEPRPVSAAEPPRPGAEPVRGRRARRAVSILVHDGVLLGVAAGLGFGASDIAVKALTRHTSSGLGLLLSPWTLTAVVASVGSFYASARSLQIGEGLSVITATTAAANLSSIAAGVLVFGDPIGTNAITIIARVTAFGLVVTGALVMPAPVRAVAAPSPRPSPRTRHTGPTSPAADSG